MTTGAFFLPGREARALERALAGLGATGAGGGLPFFGSAGRARLEAAIDRLLAAVAGGLVAAIPTGGARIDGLGRQLRAQFRGFAQSLLRGLLETLRATLAEALARAIPGLSQPSARGQGFAALGASLARIALPALTGAPISPFGGLARGGRVAPGRAFLVGEAGPELFVPPAAGEIVPNERLSAASGARINVVQNFDFRGADLAAVAALRREADRIKRALVAEIAASAQRGGAFARLPRV